MLTRSNQEHSTPRPLSEQHRLVLTEGSGISPAVIAERGYWTATSVADLDGLGFKGTQKGSGTDLFPALVIPQHDPTGELTHSVLRYDRPRTRRDGGVIKYEQPAGYGLRLDVPPRCLAGLRDAGRPLWWTEGAKKADALASRGVVVANTPGVDGWRSPTAIPDLFGIPFKERDVVCAYDSDVLAKPAVRLAVVALARWMGQRGGVVAVVDWARADLAEGVKVGVDDFFALGHTLRDLEALLVPFDDWQASAGDGPVRSEYLATGDGLVWVKRTADGVSRVPLTNFVARIVAEVAQDDGTADVRRMFELAAETRHGRSTFAIPATGFPSLQWVSEHLGAEAWAWPGLTVKEHARTAIQVLSSQAGVQQRRVYVHLGWRESEHGPTYLHAGGAISGGGALDGIDVSLPQPLARFTLPVPPDGPELAVAVLASLGVMRVGPLALTAPLLAAAYMPPVACPDFGFHLVGPSGAFKSELAALAQQHYGAGLDRRHLPAGWSSTGNALEGLAFAAKDALLVVDDFAPTGTSTDVQRLHREADRLFRGIGNGAGRQRMSADTSLRPHKPPRGTIVSTGEDTPNGISLRARLVVLEVEPDAVDRDRLTACQRDAAQGLYAGALAAYVRWLAGRLDDVRRLWPAEVARLRAAAVGAGRHRRDPDKVAALGAAWRLILTFAFESGALDAAEAVAMADAVWPALLDVAEAQAAQQAAAEPTARFLELLGGALAAGRGHVTLPDGSCPRDGTAWGWREATIGTGDDERTDWRPQGECVGWLDRDDLYLEPDVAYAAAQRLARDGHGEAIAVGRQTLNKRLAERGILATTEQGRGKLTVRRQLGGRRRNVLHLRADSLDAGEAAQPAQAAGARADGRVRVPYGPVSPLLIGLAWADSAVRPPAESGPAAAAQAPADETHQATAQHVAVHPTPEGPVGPLFSHAPDPAVRAEHVSEVPVERDPCWACGETAWVERPASAGGGAMCGVCHPIPEPRPERRSGVGAAPGTA